MDENDTRNRTTGEDDAGDRSLSEDDVSDRRASGDDVSDRRVSEDDAGDRRANVDDLTIALIAAVAENGVIGRDGSLPWHYPNDLRRFKEVTMGHPVVMGRRTYEGILERLGEPLPGRTSIVLTSRDLDAPDGIERARSIREAIDLASNVATGMAESTEDQPEELGETEDQAESTADQPESTADQPESTADQPESTEDQPESTEDQPESTEDQPGSIEPVAYVIGGASVYEQFLELADRLVLTEIHEAHAGDTYFPEVDWADWLEVEREEHEELSFVTYERTEPW